MEGSVAGLGAGWPGSRSASRPRTATTPSATPAVRCNRQWSGRISASRNSIFYQHTGDDHIAQAFINARAVDKKAGLYYNDYNIEADAAKLQTLMGMPDGFKARSAPVTGVGFQMHMYMDYPSIATISGAFRQAVQRNHADWPLLFDGSNQQKPALRGVADGLSGKACTNA